MGSSFETESHTPDFDTLGSLAENLVYLLPGCSDIMVRKTLQEVYRDFCRRSCCLCGRRQFTLDSDGIVSVNPMYGGYVDCVSEVRYNGRILGTRDYTFSGTKLVFREALCPDENTPEDQFPIIAVVHIEIPKLGSEQIPNTFIQRHGEAVRDGVLSRLMAMTGKAWSDPQQAAESRIRYENAVCIERVRYHAGDESGNLGTAFNPDGLV